MINNNIIIILKVWFRFQYVWTKSQNSTCSAKSLPKTPTSALSNHQLVHIATYARFPTLTRSSSPLLQLDIPPFSFSLFPFVPFYLFIIICYLLFSLSKSYIEPLFVVMEFCSPFLQSPHLVYTLNPPFYPFILFLTFKIFVFFLITQLCANRAFNR